MDDVDQPECPIDCHRYIVYRALEEMLFKHNQDAQSVYYGKKAEKELQKIEERYLTQRSALYIKDSFRVGPMRVKPFRTMTKTEMRQLFPFALDSIFLIDGQVYELLDRVDYWDYKNQRESFKYKMRKFDDEGTWFEVSHERLIAKDYEVVHRALFMRHRSKWMS